MEPDYLCENFLPFRQPGLLSLQENLFSQITLLKLDLIEAETMGFSSNFHFNDV